jgi:hypothetical protein
MKNLFMLGILIIFCGACKTEHTSQPIQETYYLQWKSFDLHNYTIDQIRSCFCPYGGEKVRITVRSDTISRVIRISDDSLVTYPYYVTVDSLFGFIKNLKTDSLVIRYSVQYGYPEFLDVDPQLHPVDGGFLYETSNLRIP